MAEQYELARISSPPATTMPPEELVEPAQHDPGLHKRTLRELDWLLLPFLALLFLFNSLDKSNARLPFCCELLTLPLTAWLDRLAMLSPRILRRILACADPT